MAESPPTEPPHAPANDREIARAIRFAVYLTGGLVVLAFDINELGVSLGEVLNCLAQTGFCSGGFSPEIYLNVVPVLCGAGLLIVVGGVLLYLARLHR